MQLLQQCGPHQDHHIGTNCKLILDSSIKFKVVTNLMINYIILFTFEMAYILFIYLIYGTTSESTLCNFYSNVDLTKTITLVQTVS